MCWAVYGEVSEFDILLDKKNSFELQIPEINKDEGIRLKQIGKVPTYFDTEFDDTEEYIELLKE